MLNLSEILPVYLIDRQYLSVAVTGDKNAAYLVGFRGHGKLIIISGKFATVSRGIWRAGPRNFEKLLMSNELDRDGSSHEDLLGLFQNEDMKTFGLF